MARDLHRWSAEPSAPAQLEAAPAALPKAVPDVAILARKIAAQCIYRINAAQQDKRRADEDALLVIGAAALVAELTEQLALAEHLKHVVMLVAVDGLSALGQFAGSTAGPEREAPPRAVPVQTGFFRPGYFWPTRG